MKGLKSVLSIALSMAVIISMSAFAMPDSIYASSAAGSDQNKMNIDITYATNGEISYPVYSDPSILMPSTSKRRGSAAELPSTYDLSSVGRVTSVKDQRGYGACWAFANIAALESNLISQGIADSSIDLSERHLAYFTYHGADSGERSIYAGNDTFNTVDGSGNIDGSGTGLYNEGAYSVHQVIATIVRGYGAVNEASAPYQSVHTPFSITDMGTVSQSLKTKSLYTVTESRTYPDVVNQDGTLNAAAMDMVKQGLMKYGACSISYYEDHEYIDKEEGLEMTHPCYNVKHKAYYSTEEYPDHMVTLVGWSDTFPKEYFGGTKGLKPSGDGAWLVKGSYGTRLSADGYYWISYYTPSITDITQIIGQRTPSQDIYQYDGTGVGLASGYEDTVVKGANVFTARKSEYLKAVGTWTRSADSTVNVKIYKNVKSGSPVSGTKIADKTYVRTYAGYHKLSLGKSLKVSKGQKFSVVITTKYNDGSKDQYLIPFEVGITDSNLLDLSGQKKGESFIYYKGKWEDTKDDSDIGNGFYISNALAKVYAN